VRQAELAPHGVASGTNGCSVLDVVVNERELIDDLDRARGIERVLRTPALRLGDGKREP
jgi:hypothetical protein